MKAAVAIENWKQSIFERHLKQNGYEFKQSGSITEDSMLLTVTTENVEALAIVLQKANDEASMTGAPK